MVDSLISIITPVYKLEENLLRNSIESVLKQSYTNLELLLIDDGSPDFCGEICDEYAVMDSRVRCIHTENQGVSSARNTALKECKGEYIMFLDGDDYLSVNMVRNLYNALRSNDADCAMCGCKKVFSVEEDLGVVDVYQSKCVGKAELMDDLFYMRHPYDGFEMTSVWGKLYKRQIISDNLFNKNMKIGEDFVFNLHVFQNVSKMVYIQTNEHGYFIREDSAMRVGFDERKMKVLDELELVVDKYKGSIYETGVISRSVNIAIVLLLMIPIDDKYVEWRNAIQTFIKKYRWNTLVNKNTRKKVRYALLTSYLGFNTMQRLFERFS